MLRPPSGDTRESLEAATALYQSLMPDPLPPYLAERGTSRATSESFRLGLVGTSPTEIYPGHEHMAGRLAIPALGPNGVQSIRFRCLDAHDCDETDCSKYLGVPGIPTRPFNLRAVKQASDRIVITEGEMDAITLSQLGIPAVGITGANNWKPHYARIFSGFGEVVVVGDNDDAGREFVEKVSKAVLSARQCKMFSDVPHDDVTSFWLREGTEALRKALGLKEAG